MMKHLLFITPSKAKLEQYTLSAQLQWLCLAVLGKAVAVDMIIARPAAAFVVKSTM